MAIIGEQLLQPESGWKRYDNKNPLIQYNGSWFTTHSDARFYQSGEYWGNDNLATIKFKIKSSRLRIIGYSDANRSQNFKITANGTTVYTGDYKASGIIQSMVADINLETSDIYIIEISSLDTKSIGLDAIDIDSDGKLLHPILLEKSKLEEMSIGDIISCEYTAASGAVGTFANLGNATKDVIPPASVAAPNGSFYFVKVDENLLVADRVVQHSITWDALNAGGYIEGTRYVTRQSPLMTDFALPSPYKVTTSLDYGGAYSVWRIFDGAKAGSNGGAFSGSSGWIAIDLGAPKQINSYTIFGRGGGVDNGLPKSWTLEGSNDGTNWTIVDTRTNITDWDYNGYKIFDMTETVSYRHYKINVSANMGAIFTVMGELELNLVENAFIRSLSGGSAYMDYLKKKEVALHLPLVSDIVDKSPIPSSVTITGTSTMPVVQDGAGKFGNNSLYFNGTNSTLTLPNNVCNFGTRDFTIDCWVKIPNVTTATFHPLISNTNGSTIWNGVYIVDNNASKKIGILDNTSLVRALVSTKRVDDDIYHHIVIQRRNGILQIFIDGILDASVNYPNNMNWNVTPNIYIGAATSTLTHPLKGYINDLRIIKGTGIYEGNFTPPTGLLPKQVSELDIPIMSTTSQAIGAFPNTNEWDKYIVNSDLEGKINPGDNNIWNCNVGAWSKETPSSGVLGVTGAATANTNRTFRGFIDSYGGTERINFAISTSNTVYHGFRPVLQLKHDNQSNVWR